MFDENKLNKLTRSAYYKNYSYKKEFESTTLILKDIFKDEDLLYDILNKFIYNNIDISIHIDYITNMFNDICIKRNDEEKGIFRGFVDLYIKNNNLFINYDNFEKCISAFDNKLIALELFRNLARHDSIKDNENIENLGVLIDYVLRARSYYVSDRSLLSATITLLDEIDPVLIKYGEISTIKEIINKRLKDDKKREGIYDVDRDMLYEFDNKIDSINDSKNSINTLIDIAEDQRKSLRLELKNTKDILKEVKINAITNLKNEANRVKKEINTKLLEIENNERESVYNERDLLISDINNAATEATSKLEAITSTINKRVTTEINRVTNMTNESVKRLEKLNINEDMIEKIATVATSIKPNTDITQKTIQIPSSEVYMKESKNTDVLKKPTDKINYYFDESIPFKERYNKLMDLKKKDMDENGTIYHEKFDDVLKLIMEGQTPYMYGPSGCGKTYIVEVGLAKLLGLDVISNGYVLYEQDIIGYTNSGVGEYVPSNFYRAYKFGKIIFLDELDNGIANATVVLNRFINGHSNYYTFPDGITINKHPNFRMIAAGNTKGNGRTYANNTRQKMDESVMQRLVPIEINYDNRIEKNILKDYEDWYKFSVEFRKAIERQNISSIEDINTIGTFTTRDALAVKKYLDDECFNDKQIMDYVIIGTKDMDYLEGIRNSLEKQIPKNKLLKVFNDVIKERREKIKCKQI